MARKPNRWKMEFRLVPHLDDLKLLHIADVTHHYPRHLHEEFCIAMILRGKETHICRGNRYDAVAGDLLVLNAEEAHESRSIRVEYKAIQINPKTFTRIWLDGFENNWGPFFAEPVITDVKLFRSFMRLYSILGSSESVLEQEARLISAIERLLSKQDDKRCHQEPVEPRSVKKVRDYLREHYSENVSLSTLASIADLSPFHLVRVFSNNVGVPPHEYQTQVRVTQAQQMMRNGSAISDAAIETGFFDQSHFSRHFKRITGFTPGAYLQHSNIVQDN